MNRKAYVRLQQLLYHASEGGLGDYGEREELKSLVDQLRDDERELSAQMSRARRMIRILAAEPVLEGDEVRELMNGAIRNEFPKRLAARRPSDQP
ncbi:hypothetical protein AB0I27_22955 [Streptomyces sp. NPDC050597]|uniref:hypothetical protein n=1 Tax=Streptomyces sp. NPDC050597 TaxID=3157212 RepID=UPI00343F5BAC